MIRRIETLEKNFLSTIQVKRHKTIKTESSFSRGIMFTKIMNFAVEESIAWVEHELIQRVETLCLTQEQTYLGVQLNEVLEAEIKIEQKQKTLYLTKRFLTGYSLTSLLQNEQQYAKITNPDCAKQLVWEILGALLIGKGFSNLIVTHYNLLFQLTGVEGYKPNINYLSFVGFRFLQFKEEIDIRQYKQIAIFIDQQALKTGNIDRFEFKARNFACLILILIVGKDITDTVLKNADFGNTVSIEKAKSLFKFTVQPKLQQLIKHKEVKARIDALQINGLRDFISQALDIKQRKLNWSEILLLLNKNTNSPPKNGQVRKKLRNETKLYYLKQYLRNLAKQLWQLEDQTQKSKLLTRGMQYVQANPFVYLTLKMGINLQTLLKDSQWQFLGDGRYNRWKRKIYYSLLQNHLKEQCKNVKIIKYLLDILKSVLDFNEEIQNRIVHFISHQRRTLMAYEQLVA